MWDNGKFTENLTPGYGKYVPRKMFGYNFERLSYLDKKRHPLNFKVDREIRKI